MADYGTRKTDEAVKRAERRLRAVYREAQDDIGDKLKTWQEAHKAREARYRKMVADGKMSQEDFDAWMRGQVFQGKQWAARKKEIDEVLLNADKAAAKIVNEGKVGVFADNANYIGYHLEHDLRIDSGFTLYDESTVARLIQDDPQILPMPAPGVVKDKAFPYYNKLMSSAITQGIIQGETIPQIAKRIMEKTSESSYSSAVRNARTAYTGAQNAGRIEGMHQAQRLGIEVKKKWMATLDFRTRDTHRELDGQIRDVDEPFQVDGEEIMFPCDPKAKPSLVWNCRCSLVDEYPQYVGIGANVNGTNVLLKGQVQTGMQRLDNITRETIGDMTYREWEAFKSGKGQSQVLTMPKFGVETKQDKIVIAPKYADEMTQKGYVGLSGAESDAFIDAHHNKKIIGRRGSNTMDGAQSKRINTALRNDRMPTDEKDLNMVKKLDDGIQKNTLPSDMTLFRGVSEEAFKDTGLFDNIVRPSIPMEDFKDARGVMDWDAWGKAYEQATDSWLNQLLNGAKKMRGMEITDKGYMQVSASSQRNIFNFSAFNIQLHAPSGTNAYISDYKGESEIILGRGTSIRILDATIAEVTASNGVKQKVVQLIAEIVT